MFIVSTNKPEKKIIVYVINNIPEQITSMPQNPKHIAKDVYIVILTRISKHPQVLTYLPERFLKKF